MHAHTHLMSPTAGKRKATVAAKELAPAVVAKKEHGTCVKVDKTLANAFQYRINKQ